MKITIALDSDTEQLLREAMRQTGDNLNATLNRAIRQGLADVVTQQKESPYVVKAKDMGLRPGIDGDKINQFIHELEIEHYLELTCRLEQESSERQE